MRATRPRPATARPRSRKRIAETPIDSAEFSVAPGTFDPRHVIAALDSAIPKDWDMVSGSGHQAYFQTHMRGRKPENFHVLREFGAIGNSISIAMGVAAAKDHGKVALIEGDGSLLMHIQELETIRRHGLKLLICVLNDGAYGAEIHKLRQDGLDDSGAIFGRTDFTSICQGLWIARDERHRSRSVRVADEGLRRPGHGGNLEHPDLRSGDLAQHAPGQGQRPRRDVGFECSCSNITARSCWPRTASRSRRASSCPRAAIPPPAGRRAAP